MSKVFAGYHVVFATKSRKRTLPLERARLLYGYIHGCLEKRNCKTFRINGMEDHVHIAFDLNASLALADVVREIKRGSSHFLGIDNGFPDFDGWGRGYYAHTFSIMERDGVIEYIRNQREHHSNFNFLDEIKEVSSRQGLAYHPDDWE
ncbi:MAG: IS200/IS605 family transposase [Muribaculaceae bacterium]|nr:IS200/IS605 family transposase [Muribaculaceae bacterium]